MARKDRTGFSLGEILVAVAIIAVLAAVVLPSIGSQLTKGDESRVEQDLNSIRSATEQFLADVRRYPSAISQLVGQPAVTDTGMVGGVYATSQVNRWRGPYLTKDSTAATSTGFGVTMALANGVQAGGSQKFLIIQLANLDSLNAVRIDAAMDDADIATGTLRWEATGKILKYYALPIQ
jgi:prepilin-type N-terminal cleavage/methylation domain-containing protein